MRPTLGDPWAPGAIGNAAWSGVALFTYGVSIPIAKALSPEVLLAYAMNVNSGASSQVRNTLDQLRAGVNCYYSQTCGGTLAWQKIWGSSNPLLYAPAAVSGSANGKLDSNGFIFELNWAPFGKGDSWAQPWVNPKLGAQYTLYTRFNGGAKNHDDNGRNASGNNTQYLFACWCFDVKYCVLM